MKWLAESYENVLRLILVILILFFIATAMRVRDTTGNFIGLRTLPYYAEKPALVSYGEKDALNYGCADTDGGENKLKKGTVYYRVNGRVLFVTDSCEDSETLLEWACLGASKTNYVGGVEVASMHKCSVGCVDGACVDERFAREQGYPYQPGL